MSRNKTRMNFQYAIGKGTHTLCHCLVMHWMFDSTERDMVFTLAIPNVLALLVRLPLLPKWLGGTALSGGPDERSEYGIWHDYYQTTIQFRNKVYRTTNVGYKKRFIHTDYNSQRSETVLDLLAVITNNPETQVFRDRYGNSGLAFYRCVNRIKNSRYWIPDSYHVEYQLHVENQFFNSVRVGAIMFNGVAPKPLAVFHCLENLNCYL